MRGYARLLSWPLRRWPGFLAIVVVALVSSATAAIEPWPMKLLVDSALGEVVPPKIVNDVLQVFSLTPTRENLVVVAALAGLAAFVFSSCLDVISSWLWSRVGHGMVYELGADLLGHLARLSPTYHAKHSVGDALNRVSGDAWSIYTITERLINVPFLHGWTLLTVGAVAWQLDHTLALLSLLIAPILALSTLYFGARAQVIAEQGRVTQSNIFSSVHQALSSILLVQAFNSASRNAVQFRGFAADALGVVRRGNILGGFYGLMTGLTTTAGTALILYVGALRVVDGTMSVGSLLLFLAYLRTLQGATQGLLSTYNTMKSIQPQISRVLEILDAEQVVRDAPGAKPLPDLPSGQKGHIVFEQVTFGYEPGRPVLMDINLDVQPGETIAVVGPTGAGKSTLVSLILRFFDPWQGRVLFDGADLRDVQLASLRSSVAIVLQEPFLLPLTIAENIAYGRPDASREEIVAAAQAANADEFIRRLPAGYDSMVGERGATLSGGEKQRIAIARALLKDAPILILDEPTSSLDTLTEGLLLEALERLMAGRTTFVIAHRLSTIRNADRIVVLEHGRVVEAGTHAELMAHQGLYADFRNANSDRSVVALGAEA